MGDDLVDKRELGKLKREREKAFGKNDLRLASSLSNNIGRLYSKMGNYKKALEYHLEERQLAESVNERLDVAVGHRNVGECLAELGRFPEALREAEKYLNLAEELEDKKEIQRAYATIGKIWHQRYEDGSDEGEESVGMARYLDKANEAFGLALKACDDLSNDVSEKELREMKASLHLNLGLVSEERKDLDSAEKYYHNASLLAKKCDNHKLTWQILFNLAVVLINARMPNRALVVLEDCLEYSEKSKNKRDRSTTLSQIATVHVKLVDLSKAKKSLKSALKLSDDWSDEEQQVLVKKYRLVNKVLSLSDAVTSGVYSDISERIKVYDRLGDMCAHGDYQFYEAAVKFYQMELQLAEDHGFEMKDLSKIYFSIAETYLDNRQYKEALEFYKKELNIWQGHPPEEACTWTNIARVYEATNEMSGALSAYSTALELASSVKNYKVLVDVYDSLISYCQNKTELVEQSLKYEEELESLLAEHPEVKRPIKTEGQTGSQEATPLDSEDLKEELILSSSESEDDEEDPILVDHTQQTRQLRGLAVRRKAKHSKRNEKGETPLHVASISGHLNMVVNLLADGADVNARDYCGWTPLHEACNHGHLSVVDTLLKHGADINDVGGISCNVTTPLMDAISNGHVGVVSLLLDNGADLSIKNKQDKCSLGVLLDALDKDPDDEDYLTIKDKLIEAMRAKGLNGLISESTGRIRGNTGSFIQRISSSSSKIIPPVAVVHPLQQDITNSQAPALIPVLSDEEEEEPGMGGVPVEEDGWLLDDMAPPHKKRRRTHPLTRRSSGQQDQRQSSQRKRRRQSNPLAKRRSFNQNEESDDQSNDYELNSNGTPTQSPLPPFLVPPSPTHSFPLPTQSDLTIMQSVSDNNSYFTPTQSLVPPTHSSFVRIKVRVEDGVFLVPCPWQQEDGAETTIGTLAEAASERYFRQNGRRPLLSLTTSEGAFLCPTDRLVEVLQDGNEAVGVVKHWETPPIAQHYESVCERFNTSVHSDLLQLFQSSLSLSSSSSLSFSNIGLQSKHCLPLFHTLMAYPSLTSLCFTGVFLTDSSLHHLGSLLSSLPTLCHLDLSCTGISGAGLQSIVQALTTPTNSSPRLALKSLKLSHNELGPFAGSSLSLLLSSTPSLTHLSLTDCGITGYTLEAHTGFTGALAGLATLKELVLDHNLINDDVNCLAGLSLSLLSLNSTLSSSHSIKLPSSLLHLGLSCCPLGYDNLLSLSSYPQLQSLNISGSLSSIDDAEPLTSSLSSLSSLSKLDLSGNRCLGNDGCVRVLEACTGTRVQTISLMDCRLLSPLQDKMLKCMTQLRLNRIDLRCNDICTNDVEMLKNLLSHSVYV